MGGVKVKLKLKVMGGVGMIWNVNGGLGKVGWGRAGESVGV